MSDLAVGGLSFSVGHKEWGLREERMVFIHSATHKNFLNHVKCSSAPITTIKSHSKIPGGKSALIIMSHVLLSHPFHDTSKLLFLSLEINITRQDLKKRKGKEIICMQQPVVTKHILKQGSYLIYDVSKLNI